MVEDPFLASSANSELANVSFATDLIDPDDEVVAYWEKRSGEGHVADCCSRRDGLALVDVEPERAPS